MAEATMLMAMNEDGSPISDWTDAHMISFLVQNPLMSCWEARNLLCVGIDTYKNLKTLAANQMSDLELADVLKLQPKMSREEAMSQLFISRRRYYRVRNQNVDCGNGGDSSDDSVDDDDILMFLEDNPTASQQSVKKLFGITTRRYKRVWKQLASKSPEVEPATEVAVAH